MVEVSQGRQPAAQHLKIKGDVNMKRRYVVLTLALLAALLVTPGPARSEMYVEGYLGGNFAADASTELTFGRQVNSLGYIHTDRYNIPGTIDRPSRAA